MDTKGRSDKIWVIEQTTSILGEDQLEKEALQINNSSVG